MSLPESVDDKNISANIQDGVVEIIVEGGANARSELKRIQLRKATR
jgi:HSP20 family molecular chaperone IbpA